MADTAASITAQDIVARLERLPISPWHTKVRIILGSATFFDAFDVLAIAFVLPTLIGLWKLTPEQIGLLISSGFIGQGIGSVLFGWLGERYGRIFALRWSIVVLFLFGLACAFAWGFWSLLVFRMAQGLGLGGELPVAATYINEIAKAHQRGRFVLLYQVIFPFGVLACSLSSIWLVPHLGWQSLFVIGAAPAFLILFLRRTLPESPRWLARCGHIQEAHAILATLETELSGGDPRRLPPPQAVAIRESEENFSWSGLFKGIYLKRTITIWILWFCCTAVGFGLQAWLPAMFRSVYKLPVAASLAYSSFGNVAICVTLVVVALLIDRAGRKPVLFAAFAVSAVPLALLGVLQNHIAVQAIMVLSGISLAFIAISQLTLWLYTPENYPTRMRSVGAGTAAVWARAAGMITPVVIGFLLPTFGIESVFFMLSGIAVVGALTVGFLVFETSKKTLEQLSI